MAAIFPTAEASPSSDNQVPAEVATTKGDTMPEELSSSLSKEKDRGFWGRTRLPVPMFSKNDFSLWSILKQCIGKELSKITMPVVFNEPLSFLQRISENMEYSHLLVQADEATDPIDRIELVTAFAVSALSSNLERLSKPFNPLLGETYELVRDDVGFRMVCEQVSHHPPVSAFHAESPHFKVHGSVYPKLKFWGKSIEIKPEGHLTVDLLSHGESYTWTNVNCCIHNIIVGKLWFEQYGVMEIVCQKSGLTSSLTFKQAGWFYKDLHRIEGFIFDKQKSRLRFLYGKWTDYLKAAPVAEYEEYMQTHNFRAPEQPPLGTANSASAGASPAHTPKRMYAKLNSLTRSLTGGSQGDVPGPKSPEPCDLDDGEIPKSDSTYSLDIPNSRLLWRVTPRPECAAQYYNFTLFAMALNEMEEGMEKELPRTDCRLRPDMRRLEAGDLAMQRAVMATYHHVTSTDQDPHHELCPEGAQSWCRHRAAEAKREPQPKHKRSLPDYVAAAMLPIYERLSQKSLLQRCLGAKTQNASESFHSILWSLMPKEQHSSLIAVETALHEAVLRYNAGCCKATQVISDSIGLQPGHLAIQRAREKNALCLKKNSKRHQEKMKARQKKKRVRQDTSSYCAGAF
ncbi:hypothetical protein HPB51_009479 [Rhipicephalus microplus]|uniref:Oxysterol-binding protein n=1 Tax=Rhipicephalus microplus TaxID=6941 RepID=A0A9J6DTV3_RHIMP|nr:hypothetical protein HPB51_009479 [Rhipicephalus microplus]